MTVEFAEILMNLMIFAPLLGLPLIFGMKKDMAKYTAFGVSLIPFVLSLLVYVVYISDNALSSVAAQNPDGEHNHFVLDTVASWIALEDGSTLKVMISYFTALDGISIYLVLLTTFIFPLTIAFSWGSVSKHEKAYYALLLILEVGVIGFFMAMDMILFYIFFEMVLIPMYFLIGIWGGKERIYASIKFFLYTLFGSLLMLIAIIYVCLMAGGFETFISDYTVLLELRIPPETQTWLFLAFMLSFAIKVPLFPLHTWLPDAHTQAPTAGSVILAAVLLKMGTYGLIRFCLPLFPDASVEFAPMMCTFAVIGIVYGGMAAMVQKDVKKLVAYSSVSHLGFIVLGIFSFTEVAINGAVMQMVNHGISTGALFLMVGMIYDRRHSRMIEDFGGIAKQIPIFTVFFMITVLSSVGLPGLNGFIGEFMVLVGSFTSSSISGAFAILAALGVIVAAVYLLWMFRRVMFGPLEKEENKQLTDLTRLEVAVMIPLVIFMFWLGLYPTPFLKEIDKGSKAILEQMKPENKSLSVGDYETLKPEEMGSAE